MAREISVFQMLLVFCPPAQLLCLQQHQEVVDGVTRVEQLGTHVLSETQLQDVTVQVLHNTVQTTLTQLMTAELTAIHTV